MPPTQPPKSTPTNRVVDAVVGVVRTAATFCPTIRLEQWPGTYPPPFNDSIVRQATGFFGVRIGQVERTEAEGSVFVHLVVQVPRSQTELLDSYRDWLQELLVPWGALLADLHPLLCCDMERRVTHGPLHDDGTTFLSQPLVFVARWEALEVYT